MVLRELRRPFTPEAIGWKIQTNPKENKKAMLVAFINARNVAARLNAVAPEWDDGYQPGLHGSVICHLTVLGHTRSDVGFATVPKSPTGVAVKTLYSDAFKRAGVKFGIGAFLYSLPRQYAPGSDLRQVGDSWYLTPKVEGQLRKAYLKWLNGDGKEFGSPLGHGDAEDAQGDIEGDSAPDEQSLERQLPPEKVEPLRNAVLSAGLEEHLDAKLRSLAVGKIEDLNVEQSIAVYEWAQKAATEKAESNGG
jgi:hypothetical protein